MTPIPHLDIELHKHRRPPAPPRLLELDAFPRLEVDGIGLTMSGYYYGQKSRSRQPLEHYLDRSLAIGINHFMQRIYKFTAVSMSVPLVQPLSAGIDPDIFVRDDRQSTSNSPVE